MTSHDVFAVVLLPAVSGLIAGFFLGLVTGIHATLRWVARRRERDADMPIYTDEANPSPGHVPWRGREHLSRLGWALVVLGVIGIVLGSFSLYRNTATQNCLREYIRQSSEVSQQRAVSGDIDRTAIRQVRKVDQEFYQLMINAVTHPVTDPAAQEKARQDFLIKANDWNARLAEVDRLDQEAETKRQQNPLPPPPDC